MFYHSIIFTSGFSLSTSTVTFYFLLVAMGLLSTVTSMFCGFLIKVENFPKFWIFMYYLNPLQ